MTKQPFNKSLEEIAKLTPFQVRRVLFRQYADSPYGDPAKSAAQHPFVVQRLLFWKIMKDQRGLPEEEVQRLWQKRVSESEELKFWLKHGVS